MSRADPRDRGDDPSSSTVVVRRHRLRVSDTGTTGVPLLLLNGLGAPIEAWASLRAALGTRRTIAFDAPGTGRSSTPVLPATIAQLARVASELAPERFDVLGYSFGGAIAQELARRAPARVRRVVLAATNCGWGAPFGDPFALTGAVSTGADTEPAPDLLGYWWQVLAISTWSSLPWLASVTQPVLVLAGDDDRVVPLAAAEQLVRVLPRAQLATVAGDHWFLMRPGDALADAAARIAEHLDHVQPAVAPSEDTFACT